MIPIRYPRPALSSVKSLSRRAHVSIGSSLLASSGRRFASREGVGVGGRDGGGGVRDELRALGARVVLPWEKVLTGTRGVLTRTRGTTTS
jgi:hypothetical protein